MSSVPLPGLVAVTLLLGAGGAAAATTPADAPPAAYTEVPVTAHDDGFAIVPRQDDKRAPAGYAIVTEPTKAARSPIPSTRRTPTFAVLPDRPPLTVVIRYDARRAGDAATAAALAARLGHDGATVTAVANAASGAAASVAYVFAEDRDAAAGLVHLLPGALAHLEPHQVDGRRMPAAQPGLVEITLGDEKGTT